MLLIEEDPMNIIVAIKLDRITLFTFRQPPWIYEPSSTTILFNNGLFEIVKEFKLARVSIADVVFALIVIDSRER